MNRAPDWTEDEFKVLIENPTVSDEELEKLLPRRSLGAVGVVRCGFHAYHTGRNKSMLSKMMVRMFEHRKGTVVCPKCGERF